MAILPVSNMLQATDVVGNFQRGLAFGQQQREAKRQDEERQQLRNLAPSIQQGDPAAFGQAAAIDHEYAAAQQSAGDNGLRRLKGAIGFIEQAQKSGNPQAVEAAYQQVRPYLARFGQQPPATFAEAEPKFMEAKARIAMLDQGGQQQRNLSVSPGSAIVDPATGQVIYERPFAPQNQSFEFNGPDGRPRRFTFNTRTGQYEEAQLGGGAPQPTRFQTSTGEVIDISQVADPNVRAQILANPQQFGMVPDGGSVQLPPAQGGMPLVGRAPEEQAALTTGAQEAAKLQYLPEAERIKADAAIREATIKAQDEARIKREADLATAEQKKYVDATTTLSLLDEAEALINQSTGSRAGALRDDVAATFGYATEGAQAIAALNPVAARLTLAVPRMEGPQSDADRLLYQKAAGDFANPQVPRETRIAALQQMRRLANKYKGVKAPSAPANVPSAVNPQTGERLYLRNGQWVPE